MAWKNLSLQAKLGVGFGALTLLMLIVGGWAVMGIGRFVDDAGQVIEGNRLRGMIAQREVDHLDWAANVNMLLTNDTVTTLDVQTDPHKCGLGSWYYGEERKEAEVLVPELAPLLAKMEQPHRNLHESAIQIGKHFKQADPHLPALLASAKSDLFRWSASVYDAFFNEVDHIDVEHDPTKCTLGSWLNSENARTAYALGDQDFRAAFDALAQSHQQLHEIGNRVEAKLSFEAWRQATNQRKQIWESMLETQNELLAVLEHGMENVLDPAKDRASEKADVDALSKWAEIDEHMNEHIIQGCLETAMIIVQLNQENILELAPRCRKAIDDLDQGIAEWKELCQGKDELSPVITNIEAAATRWRNQFEQFASAITTERNSKLAVNEANRLVRDEAEPTIKQAIAHLATLQMEAEHALTGMNRAKDIYNKQTNKLLTEVRGMLGEAGKIVRSNVMTDDEMLASAAQTRTVLIAVCVIALFFSIMAAYLIARSISKPLRQSVSHLHEISQGNFSIPVTQTALARQDEIGMLVQAIDAINSKLGSSLKSVADAATSLSGSSSQLTATATQLATSSEETTKQTNAGAAAAEQMSANMDNMAQSAHQVSENIRTVASAVEQMTASITEVAKNAQQAAGVAGNASSLADASNERIAELGTAADEIGKVIEVIQDIAEQTNLLALNATIEAARAGEAGKGFAVVATEVKELAKQTADATEDIRKRIEGIQQSTGQAVNSIGEIREVITQVNDVSHTIATSVDQQSATMGEIAQNVAQTAGAAEVISTGITESATASQEITQTITLVDRSAKNSSTVASETQNSGQSLSLLAENLQSTVEQFVLEKD